MWEDPIVAEVRRVRAELMSECNGDILELFRRAIAIQNEDEDKDDENLKRAVEEGVRSGKASREEVFRVLTTNEVKP